MKEKKHRIEIGDDIYCEATMVAKELGTFLEVFVERAIRQAIREGEEELKRRSAIPPMDYEDMKSILFGKDPGHDE